jgi:hypothetical protein
LSDTNLRRSLEHPLGDFGLATDADAMVRADLLDELVLVQSFGKMIDVVSLASERGDGFLADIFEDQQPQVLVLERVKGLWGADARRCSASTSIEIVEG